MADIREALVHLLAEHAFYVDEKKCGWCLGCLDNTRNELRRFVNVREHAAHLTDLIAAKYLIAPHSNAAVEFGIELYRRDRASWHVERAIGRDAAIAAAKREHYDDDFEGRPRTRPVQRLVVTMPWSPIPLPEDGEPDAEVSG